MINWLNKPLSEVRSSLLFEKYFDSSTLDNVENEYFIYNPVLGIDIMLKNNLVIDAIHFYSNDHEGISGFKDELPFNVKFSYSREKVSSLFGTPNETGGGKRSFLSNKIDAVWEKYYFKDYFYILSLAMI